MVQDDKVIPIQRLEGVPWLLDFPHMDQRVVCIEKTGEIAIGGAHDIFEELRVKLPLYFPFLVEHDVVEDRQHSVLLDMVVSSVEQDNKVRGTYFSICDDGKLDAVCAKRKKWAQVNIVLFGRTRVDASLVIKHPKGLGKAYAIPSIGIVYQDSPSIGVDGEW